jgi:hypothetical protein
MIDINFHSSFVLKLEMSLYNRIFFGDFNYREENIEDIWADMRLKVRGSLESYRDYLLSLFEEMKLETLIKMVHVVSEYSVSAASGEMIILADNGFKHRVLTMSLTPESFSSMQVIRHELGHVQDLLCERGKGYKRKLISDPHMNEVWNVLIDSRLEREHTPGLSKEKRWKNFRLVFSEGSEEEMRTQFERIWAIRSYTFQDIIDFVRELK